MRSVDCQREKYSVGHFNLVRRLQFADGVSWIDCDPETFGTPEQDVRFRQQMVDIHVQLASLTFDRIGSLRESHDNPGDLFIGSEVETGEGPWDTAQQYYSAVARHRLQVAEHDAEPQAPDCDFSRIDSAS